MTGPGFRAASRGLTLIELVIALGVSAFTVLAAGTLLVQQQRSYTSTSADRALQETGRVAMRELVTRLRTAGYGVDPGLIFDFGRTSSVPRKNLVAPAVAVVQSSYRCDAPVTCRDSEAGSDEIVFLRRNPAFSRSTTLVTKTQLEVLGELKRPLHPGQILLVTCSAGSQVRAYVTVGKLAPAVATPDPTKTVSIELLAGSTESGLPVFPLENDQLGDGCFSLGGPAAPVVTQVDRFRYFVQWFTASGADAAPQAVGARPFLMLDQGLTDVEAIPVAPDVEDLQLSYAYPPRAAGGGETLVGATEGVNAADDAPLKMAVGDTSPPAIDDAPDAASRTTGHPANLDAVHVALVVRSAEPDFSLTRAEDLTLPAAGNRKAFPGVAGHRRALFETTVLVRNAGSQAFVYPTPDASGAPGANLGGG